MMLSLYRDHKESCFLTDWKSGYFIAFKSNDVLESNEDPKIVV